MSVMMLRVLVLAATVMAGSATPDVEAQDDALAIYLETLELRSLLVTRLEQLVAETPPDDRGPLLDRLAALYAELLDEARDPDERRRLLDRANAFVRRTGRDRTESLELAIARADYRSAERTAERWRLRSIGRDELPVAELTLAEVANALDDLASRAQRTLERARTDSNRAVGTRAIEISERLDEALVLRGEIEYLAGWTAYYRGWLGDPSVNLFEAEERFERLLELGDAGAVPSAVDRDLIGSEGYARAVLGMALMRGLSARTDEVLRWLAVLDSPEAHPAVRGALPGWRLAVLVDDDAWRRVRDELTQLVGDENVPADWYRMVAARALETQGDAIADLAAREAVQELGRRGELTTLYDLAERYGTERLGSRGFLVLYVQAAADFSRAAERFDRRVGVDGAARLAWRSVADALLRALDAPDAAASERTAADAERLLGWAHWYANDAESAWPRFAAVVDRLPASGSAEAAWMTIVCLDQMILAGRGEMREEVAGRIDAFLERFPGHANAPALRARRIAAAPDRVAGQDLEALRAVPRDHPQWKASRETVAAVLARRFRAGGSGAIEAGRAYLEVAAELLAASPDDGGAVFGPPRATVDVIRLTLEIALDPRIADPEQAERALARIANWRSRGWEPGAADTELRYRLIQWELAAGRWDLAAEAASNLIDGGSPFDDAWRRAGLSRVLTGAMAAGASGRARLPIAWPLSRRVLESVDEVVVQTPDGIQVALMAAEVAHRLWRDTRDDAGLELARDAMQTTRVVHPGERRVLQVLGRVAGALGDDALALECWRTLSDGLSPSSLDWYEARFELATTLARGDGERALTVMRQHAALEPQYGPSPWGPRLRALHDRLERQAAAEEAESGDGDDPDDDPDDGRNEDQNDGDDPPGDPEAEGGDGGDAP